VDDACLPRVVLAPAVALIRLRSGDPGFGSVEPGC
jgi:hypothetical protein